MDERIAMEKVVAETNVAAFGERAELSPPARRTRRMWLREGLAERAHVAMR